MKSNISILTFYTVVSSLLSAIAQSQVPSYPITEITKQAGEGPIPIVVALPNNEKLVQPVQASAIYTLNGKSLPTFPMPPLTGEMLSCNGGGQIGEAVVHLICANPRETKAGEYKSSDGKLLLSARGERKSYADRRFPIITITPPKPLDPIIFPDEIGEPEIEWTPDMAMAQGKVETEKIYKELTNDYFGRVANDKKFKAAFIDLVEREAGIVNGTALHYARGTKGQPLPIFFDDFDERLDQVVKVAGATPRPRSPIMGELSASHLVLVQMPHVDQSVEAKPSDAEVKKYVQTFLDILNDFMDFADKFMGVVPTEFHWTVKTEPEGATVSYWRLNKEHDEWSKPTNITDENTKLPFARWTWRIDWGGCYVDVRPNPYHEKTIQIVKNRKDGCQKR